MAVFSKLNGYEVKDAQAREELSSSVLKQIKYDPDSHITIKDYLFFVVDFFDANNLNRKVICSMTSNNGSVGAFFKGSNGDFTVSIMIANGMKPKVDILKNGSQEEATLKYLAGIYAGE